MAKKRTKIIIDIVMTIFVVLSFVRWDAHNAMFHFIVGTACAAAFVAHVFVHRKWVVAVTISFFTGKIKKKMLGKYLVDLALLLVWDVSIITGFLAIGYFWGGVAEMAVFSRIHGVTARVGLALVIVHVIQHIPQIKSYFKKRGRQNGA